jgi:hypothetical protein
VRQGISFVDPAHVYLEILSSYLRPFLVMEIIYHRFLKIVFQRKLSNFIALFISHLWRSETTPANRFVEKSKYKKSRKFIQYSFDKPLKTQSRRM